MTESYMDSRIIPSNYAPALTKKQVIIAMDSIKQFVEDRLRNEFGLMKHVAPLAFVANTGVNDDLDGSDRHAAVRFHVSNLTGDRGVRQDHVEEEKYGFDAEIVQSLAKWKRLMLKRYELEPGEGIFCESFSIRKGYKGDVTHSNVCDQWDWERRIVQESRTIDYLKSTVQMIWRMIKDCEQMVFEKYGLPPTLPDDIHFITAEDLHAEFPNEDIHGREDCAVRKYGAIFIIGMGWPMKDGSAPEEIRAPDYDDWNLNGDIIVLHPVTGYRHELSSMGIRVDAEALRNQLQHRGMESRLAHAFHQGVLNGSLPLCIGGGIGISRTCMLLLQRGHVGEVQVGIWSDAHYAQASAAGIDLIPDRIV